MALIQSSRAASGGGGGGGIEITGYRVDTLTQTTNFSAGSVTITLTNTPVAEQAIRVDYNRTPLVYNVDWTYSAGVITIVFGDNYVTDYDAPPTFQVQYPY